MKNRTYIILEFVAGFGFALLGLWTYFELDKTNSFFASFFYSFIVILIAIPLGVIIVGYIHFKRNKKLNYFGKAILSCFAGLLLSILLSVLILVLIPELPGILSILIAVSGAVLGLNGYFNKLGIPI